jgi:hypothetical protein
MARLRKTALTHYISPITKVKGFEYIFNFIVTAEDSGTVTECGVCGWPWQWFALVKGERTLFVTTDWCIPVKNTLDRSAVVFCLCEIIRMFYLVFCVVWAVHRFDFRLLINGSKTTLCSDRNLFFDRVDMFYFSRPLSQRTRFTVCILFPLHCKTNDARWGRNFFVRCQLREFAQRFGVGLPPSSCTRKGNPRFFRPVKRSSFLKFLWIHYHILFLMFLHVVRWNEIVSFGSRLLLTSSLLCVCYMCARK